MARYKIEKEKGLKGYYARVYSDSGVLLDSLVFGSRVKARKSLDNLKKSGLFRKKKR